MKTSKLILTLALAVFMGATFTACSKKKDGSDGTVGVEDVKDPMSGVAGADLSSLSSDNGKAMGLQTVNFPYDSSRLSDATRNALKNNADIVNNTPNLKIQIEGHCDERGGIQYNLALGDRRAEAVKKYLVDLGVDPSRVSSISFGKERPVDPGSTEAAYAKNRRANFVITAK